MFDFKSPACHFNTPESEQLTDSFGRGHVSKTMHVLLMISKSQQNDKGINKQANKKQGNSMWRSPIVVKKYVALLTKSMKICDSVDFTDHIYSEHTPILQSKSPTV